MIAQHRIVKGKDHVSRPEHIPAGSEGIGPAQQSLYFGEHHFQLEGF